MIVHDVTQGSEEWHSLRLGVVSASKFSTLITEKTLKPSSQRRGYMLELLAAIFTGEPQDMAATPFMERGIEMEPEAARWYELQRDVDTEAVGFITTDDGRVGCSPDRLVGDRGGLEIKCPGAKGHIGYLLGDNEYAHRCQVQGSMLVTGRDWWDLLIYHPMHPHLERHEPNEKWRSAFEPILAEFLEELDAAKETLIGMGLEPATPKPVKRRMTQEEKEAAFDAWVRGEEGY